VHAHATSRPVRLLRLRGNSGRRGFAPTFTNVEANRVAPGPEISIAASMAILRGLSLAPSLDFFFGSTRLCRSTESIRGLAPVIDSYGSVRNSVKVVSSFAGWGGKMIGCVFNVCRPTRRMPGAQIRQVIPCLEILKILFFLAVRPELWPTAAFASASDNGGVSRLWLPTRRPRWPKDLFRRASRQWGTTVDSPTFRCPRSGTALCNPWNLPPQAFSGSGLGPAPPSFPHPPALLACKGFGKCLAIAQAKLVR